jgi:hypothetical protein
MFLSASNQRTITEEESYVKRGDANANAETHDPGSADRLLRRGRFQFGWRESVDSPML